MILFFIHKTKKQNRLNDYQKHFQKCDKVRKKSLEKGFSTR
jgi:hypothetical protein